MAASILALFGISSNLPKADAVSGQYKAIKLPYPAGQSREVTGTHDRAHGRHAIDFGMKLEDVLAIRGGTVYRSNYVDPAGGGKELIIDHGDDYCSVYLHLNNYKVSNGQKVSQGQPIAQSGNTGIVEGYHLHVSVTQKVNKQCTDKQSQEIAMIFDEKPGGELQNRDNTVSQNGATSNTFAPTPSTLLTITQQSLNLNVKASNITGRTVYVQMWRPATNGYSAREWNVQKQATSTSIDFLDIDGQGDVFSGVWYYTVASLTPIPSGEAAKQRTQCWSATGGKYLCDAARR